MKYRQWRLKREPQGELTSEDFTLTEQEIDENALRQGEILVKHQIMICAPAIRGWMSANRPRFVPAINPGDPIISMTGAKIIASANPDFPVGKRVSCFGSWSEYQVLEPATSGCRVIEDDLSLFEAIGVYSMNMMTAYFGLLAVGQPKAGDTVLVSGAAGSTGSAAVQIAKIKGLRVIGIAGGAEKCGWVKNEYGADAVIDYKSEDVGARLKELCPDGINVFFDNVGGDILQAGVDNIAQYGRIVLCGQIAGYDKDRPAPGPRDMMDLVYGSIRMQGFLLHDYAADFGKATADLREWVDSGRLQHREDVRRGFEDLPNIYAALFHGDNKGTLMALFDDEAMEKPA